MLIQVAYPYIFGPLHFPFVGLKLSGDYIHKSGFSFSVGADKADMLSLEQTEGYIMKNSPVPKTMGKVFNI